MVSSKTATAVHDGGGVRQVGRTGALTRMRVATREIASGKRALGQERLRADSDAVWRGTAGTCGATRAEDGYRWHLLLLERRTTRATRATTGALLC